MYVIKRCRLVCVIRVYVCYKAKSFCLCYNAVSFCMCYKKQSFCMFYNVYSLRVCYKGVILYVL